MGPLMVSDSTGVCGPGQDSLALALSSLGCSGSASLRRTGMCLVFKFRPWDQAEPATHLPSSRDHGLTLGVTK